MMFRLSILLVFLFTSTFIQAQIHVVVLGGGGGASQTLKALEKYIGQEIDSLTGVINNSDDGGSTGILRRTYATSALGDLGKCQLGLSHYPNEKLIEAMDFRFNDGPLKGHSLRNIMMSAFELHTGNINSGLELFGQLLQLNPMAKVIPVSTRAGTVHYKGKDENSEVLGQFKIAELPLQKSHHDPLEDKLDYKDITTEDFNPEASKALTKATHIILAPGNVYATMLPLLATPGLQQALKDSTGKFIVVTPLFNRLSANQTNGWTVERHLEVYHAYLGGKKIDYVVMNSGLPESVPEDYEMVNSNGSGSNAPAWITFANNFLENHQATYASTDVIKRSPIKHDIDRLADTIVKDIIGVPAHLK